MFLVVASDKPLLSHHHHHLKRFFRHFQKGGNQTALNPDYKLSATRSDTTHYSSFLVHRLQRKYKSKETFRTSLIFT